jgi:hypothetical protein
MLGDVCPTSHTYYRLRRSLMSTLELSRHDIAPAARLEDIVPRDRRRAVWRRLRMDGLELPGCPYRLTWRESPTPLLCSRLFTRGSGALMCWYCPRSSL